MKNELNKLAERIVAMGKNVEETRKDFEGVTPIVHKAIAMYTTDTYELKNVWVDVMCKALHQVRERDRLTSRSQALEIIRDLAK